MSEHEDLLRDIAEALGEELLGEIAFVGGTTISLHLDDAQPMDIRSTKDVDFIVSVAGYVEYHKLIERLKDRGFKEQREPDEENEPICRYICRGIKVDVMPDSEDVIGFSNRWFKEGRQQAVPYNLPNGPTIKIVPANYLLATKLEAFNGRGDSMLASRDAEDIVTLVNGRDTLVDEITSSPEELRSFIAREIGRFLKNKDFDYLLASSIPSESPDRLGLVKERFGQLSRVDSQ